MHPDDWEGLMMSEATRMSPEPLGPESAPPLLERRRPRCPPVVEAASVEDLLPYLREVAKRPYHHGLHASWDLHKGERVLLRVDNWHDPEPIEAAKMIFEEFGCEYEIVSSDRGPIPTYDGHDEVEVLLALTKEFAEWMDEWRELEASGKYDKLLWGFGGPILSDAQIKIQRFPFITSEMVTSPAHTLPAELLDAFDKWTWNKLLNARRIRIVDPEGTDITLTQHDEYFDDARAYFSEKWLDRWFASNKEMWRTYLPGHVWGRPHFFIPGLEDGEGVMAGTMNHIGPFPHMRMHMEKSRIVHIEGGGLFGDKLRDLEERTKDLQYPGHPDKGLLYWWEASIGTNPKIHRPRNGYLDGWNCAVYERMRSGVVHLGYGTVITSDREFEAAKQGLPVGHFHMHLYYPTVSMEMTDGSEELLIDEGRLCALDDERVRDIAARYGDPDDFLQEDWIPAVPGINVPGDYWRDYANDPTDWTTTELKICRQWHHLYMKMVGAEHGHGHHHD